MTDYTPTTEEVRDAYESTWLSDTMAGRDAQFDRWLAEVKAQAWHEGLEAAELGIANPYREGEGSGNDASQSLVESGNLLNGEEQ